MIELVQDRALIKRALLIGWEQEGHSGVISDANCAYTLTPAVRLKVRHLKTFANRPAPMNLLLRTAQVPGRWEDGNFNNGDELIETDSLSDEDGPLTITFHDAVTDAPVGVRAVGANLQSCTHGEFTGVVNGFDMSGAITQRRTLGESNADVRTVIFIGLASDVAEIQRIEFRTTNIVEDGHAPFDALGFAINQLSVRL